MLSAVHSRLFSDQQAFTTDAMRAMHAAIENRRVCKANASMMQDVQLTNVRVANPVVIRQMQLVFLLFEALHVCFSHSLQRRLGHKAHMYHVGTAMLI
jgi:hypothetical protein